MSALYTKPGVREPLGYQQVATLAAVTGGVHVNAQSFVTP